MTKTILVITYYWPPSGGAAVQRWLSFSNYLAADGWKVHILTVDEQYATFQLTDPTLKDKVHSAIRVHTTKTKEPFRVFKFLFGKNSIPKPAFSNESNPSFTKKIARFIRGNFFIPDPRKGWKKFAVAKAKQLIESEKIKCVITAGPPHSTHFIGRELKESLNVGWIADFHDLWTDVIYYDMLYHLPFIKKKDQKLERNILESADLLITVGEKYKEKLLSKSNRLKESGIQVLRIGYENGVFENHKNIAQQEFIITYTGSIADFYKPEVFIESLKEVRAKFSNVPFKLRFAGVLSEGIKNLILNSGLADVLEDLGYVSHSTSISLLKTSTILLLINPVTKDEEMVIPGKIYEYLAAQKPIINITKGSAETAGLIHHAQAGKTFERTMRHELTEYLEELVLKWSKEKTLDLDNEEKIKQFSRKRISNKLVEIIESQMRGVLK